MTDPEHPRPRDHRTRGVQDRGWLKGHGNGWWDRLTCGHMVAYDGRDALHRRCPECSPEISEEQPTLWDAS